MEVDPLAPILSSLSKLPEGYTVAIQFVMRSAVGSWRKRGVKVVSDMQQGKSLKQASSANPVGGRGGMIGAMGRSSYKYWFDKKSQKGKADHQLCIA